jgi:hypothetical protein
MVRLFGSLLAVACFAVPAYACLNDRELQSHEREFRSEYTRHAAPVPKVKGTPDKMPLMIGIGAALLGAATAATLRLSGPSKG